LDHETLIGNTMIFRLSQKLAKTLKEGTLTSLTLDENPYADWSANLFTADRTQYIILTNTQSLYSVVMFGKGIANDSRFIGRALDNIREFMEDDGQAFVYQRFISPASGNVRFAKSLNRSVTGSMNDMIFHAKVWLTEGELSPHDVGFKLNQIPMSAIKGMKSERYGIPSEAFKLLADSCGPTEGGERRFESADTQQASNGEAPDAKSETGANTTSGPTINVPFTCAQRKAIAEVVPEMADRLKLGEKKARTITFTSDELETIHLKAEQAIPKADTGMRRNSLWCIADAITKAIEDSQGIGSIPASERLYQFKITLNDYDPTIWRRIQTRDCTVDKLHERIQTAMGWENYHLHDFDIDGERYGDPALLDDGYEGFDCVDSTVTKISQIVPKDGKRFQFAYQYDFGDCWNHEVIFEGCLRAESGQRYPLCIEGERACPPEDVGGVWGYAEYLEAMADPNHERHQEFMEWRGEFDPEMFDAVKTTKAMRRGLPNWRQRE